MIASRTKRRNKEKSDALRVRMRGLEIERQQAIQNLRDIAEEIRQTRAQLVAADTRWRHNGLAPLIRAVFKSATGPLTASEVADLIPSRPRNSVQVGVHQLCKRGVLRKMGRGIAREDIPKAMRAGCIYRFELIDKEQG